MSHKLVSVTEDQTAKAPALTCHPIHIAPDPYGSPCRWWAYWFADPCFCFGLGPTWPHGRRPGHQALADGPPPQAWFHGGAPASLRAGYTCPLFLLPLVLSWSEQSAVSH